MCDVYWHLSSLEIVPSIGRIAIVEPGRVLPHVSPRGCGGPARCRAACAVACPINVITIEGGAPKVTDSDACVGCGLCVEACPTDAIVLVDRSSGHPVDPIGLAEARWPRSTTGEDAEDEETGIRPSPTNRPRPL